MKFQKRGRLGTKLLMKCHKCRCETAPKDGDWHDGEAGQVFLCRVCVKPAPTGTAQRPKLHYTSFTATARA